jgi:predicted transcriptional regulator
MTNDISKESVKKLLDHWIEHNESHSRSFRDRARQIQAISEKSAKDINEAADLMDKCTEILKRAMRDL